MDFVSAYLMASGAAVFTYVIGSAAGIRLLKERGMRRALPWTSLAVSLALLPFIGTLLVASLAIVGVGLIGAGHCRDKGWVRTEERETPS